jgi:SAM-dependent methyltransferase
MARPDTEDNCHGDQKCRESYEAVADEYVRRIADELRHKPLDRALLDKFCQRVRTMGPVCEVGCGPGHVARYLHGQGLCVTGVDLSPALIERARKLSPDVEFSVADMTALPHADGAWAGLVAFYSLIHVARDDMPRALTSAPTRCISTNGGAPGWMWISISSSPPSSAAGCAVPVSRSSK